MKNMTLTERALIIVSAALFVVLCVIAHSYVKEQKALGGAEANAKVQDAIIAAKNETIESAKARIADRDAAAAKRDKDFDDLKASIKNVPDALKEIKEDNPGAEVIEFNPKDIPSKIKAQLPDAPDYAVMTQQTAVTLAQSGVDLKACRVDLDACRKDKTDFATALKAAQDAQKRAEDKSRGWEQAAHGTWATRTVSAGKWSALGGAAVYVITQVFKKK